MACVINIKGIGEGIKLILSPEASFRDILNELYNIVRANRKFFDGDADIYITGRILCSSDKLRLESVMKTLFPSHKIIYGEPLHKKPFTPKALKAYEIIHNTDIHDEQMLMKKEDEDKKEVSSKYQHISGLTTILKNILQPEQDMIDTGAEHSQSQQQETFDWEYLNTETEVKTEFFKGDIKEGQIVRVDGNLLIEGNVLSGGVAQASGNIIIMGALQGIAWAGAAGDENAYIFALDFMPGQIRIGLHIKNIPYPNLSSRYKIKKAYVKDNGICIELY